MDPNNRPTIATMIVGVVVFLATVTAWLYGETIGVDTNILWVTATPVVMALFVGQGLSATAAAARQAAIQTNGTLDDRMKAALSTALSDHATAKAAGAVEAAYTPLRSTDSGPQPRI